MLSWVWSLLQSDTDIVSLTPPTPYKAAFIRSHPFLQISEHCFLKELFLTPQTNLSLLCVHSIPCPSLLEIIITILIMFSVHVYPLSYKPYGSRDSASHLPNYVPRTWNLACKQNSCKHLERKDRVVFVFFIPSAWSSAQFRVAAQ